MTNYANVIISAAVTIAGFIINYHLMARTFREEVGKMKTSVYLDEMSKVPMEVLELLDAILDKKNYSAIERNLKSLMARMFAYGSREAILLISSMQQLNYRVLSNPQDADADRNKAIVYYILMACQVKYDLTGLKVNPEYWYRMRLTDYNTMRARLTETNNDIVKQLQLEDFLMIR